MQREGGGGCRPSVPPKPFFGSTWPPLMPRPRGLCPDVLKVAPASLPGPIPGHRPLVNRPTEAGAGHRAAPEVLEGPDPGPLRVSPHMRPRGLRDRDLWGSGTTAQKLFLVWPHCPAHSPAPDGKTLVEWAGEMPARLALVLLQGGRPTLQTLPGYRPHSWVGEAALASWESRLGPLRAKEDGMRVKSSWRRSWPWPPLEPRAPTWTLPAGSWPRPPGTARDCPS